MTVEGFVKKSGFRALTLPAPDREISGVYIGDLLSWVMGKASPSDAWITIMSNVNVLAVATLTDVCCIVLAEDVVLDGELLSLAEEKGVNVLSTPLSAYDAALTMSDIAFKDR